jgi:hypothetical protein
MSSLVLQVIEDFRRYVVTWDTELHTVWRVSPLGIQLCFALPIVLRDIGLRSNLIPQRKSRKTLLLTELWNRPDQPQPVILLYTAAIFCSCSVLYFIKV